MATNKEWFNAKWLESWYDWLYSTNSEGECQFDRNNSCFSENGEYHLPLIMSDYLRERCAGILIDGKDVAEIGIGNGILSKTYFGDAEPTWDGYDISYQACRASEGRYKYIKKLDMNKQCLPKKYDCILGCGIFGYLHLDATGLENVYNSLNDNGFLIISIPRKRGYYITSGFETQSHFKLLEASKNFSSGVFRNLGEDIEPQWHQIRTFRKV